CTSVSYVLLRLTQRHRQLSSAPLDPGTEEWLTCQRAAWGDDQQFVNLFGEIPDHYIDLPQLLLAVNLLCVLRTVPGYRLLWQLAKRRDASPSRE
ncbi:MAG: hypothetical protein MZV70_45280, partial [Desulfobacterales bacterium]|nr:hypothetical protein [Desulfobacterales bacterium]